MSDDLADSKGPETAIAGSTNSGKVAEDGGQIGNVHLVSRGVEVDEHASQSIEGYDPERMHARTYLSAAEEKAATKN